MPAPHHSIFGGRMLFLTPSQLCRSSEGNAGELQIQPVMLISVRPIMMSDISIGHIGISPRYRQSDGNCPPISDVRNLKRALYSSLI